MTVTVQALITDALLEIGVIRENQSPSPEQLATSLRRLNQLMADWEEDGIELGYYPQSTYTATVPIPESAERAVMFNFALELAGSFGASEVRPATLRAAAQAYARLERDTVDVVEMSVDHLPGACSDSYDITSDE
jgi:hypothetical protein